VQDEWGFRSLRLLARNALKVRETCDLLTFNSVSVMLSPSCLKPSDRDPFVPFLYVSCCVASVGVKNSTISLISSSVCVCFPKMCS